MKQNSRRFLAIVAATAVLLLGQQTATVTGVVRDSSTGVAGNVEVKLINSQTGEIFSSVTNADGAYTVPLVKPGVYSLTAEAPGFKQFRQTGLILETASTARRDITLEVGEIAETVTAEVSESHDIIHVAVRPAVP